ncbi:MAG TPA: hypothetical protein VLS48_04710, partial [Anaerolineales bacterium]|nr:hypothetical protein [Anaerolineales bacterium]
LDDSAAGGFLHLAALFRARYLGRLCQGLKNNHASLKQPTPTTKFSLVDVGAPGFSPAASFAKGYLQRGCAAGAAASITRLNQSPETPIICLLPSPTFL